MTCASTLRVGTPSFSVAMAVATLGFALFGGMALLFLLVPEELRPIHYVLGSLTGGSALIMYPWQILDVRHRRYELTEKTIKYRCGIVSRYQIDIPYRSVQAVSIRQGILQRVFGCGDVRVAAHGIHGPVTLSSQDLNSVCIRSIRDFESVGEAIRERMTDDQLRNQSVEEPASQ